MSDVDAAWVSVLEAEVARLRAALGDAAGALEATAETFEDENQPGTARWARKRAAEARAALETK